MQANRSARSCRPRLAATAGAPAPPTTSDGTGFPAPLPPRPPLPVLPLVPATPAAPLVPPPPIPPTAPPRPVVSAPPLAPAGPVVPAAPVAPALPVTPDAPLVPAPPFVPPAPALPPSPPVDWQPAASSAAVRKAEKQLGPLAIMPPTADMAPFCNEKRTRRRCLAPRVLRRDGLHGEPLSLARSVPHGQPARRRAQSDPAR